MHPIQWYLKQHWTHTDHGLSSDLCQQGSGLDTPLVVRQAAPVSENASYISQHHHHYHYRCEHGGVGWLLYCAQVRLYSDL